MDTWHPDYSTAYQAAELVTRGKCAAQIAQAIYKSRGSGALKRVERLLDFAARQRIFTLSSHLSEPLQARLVNRFGSATQFHVVNNDQFADAENATLDETVRADAVCREAARVAADRIATLLKEHRDRKKNIVIATAGGLAVSRVVRFLAAMRLIPEESHPGQLLFISLNSASMPAGYGLSANVLAVRMAEIYGGGHIALCPIWPDETKKIYDEAVRNIDLLICGAGSKHGILFTWLKDQVKIALPDSAVGDLCLIPITDKGVEVPLNHHGPDQVRKFLNPQPPFSELKNLARHDRILFVAVGYQGDDLPHIRDAGLTRLHSKLAITQAIIEHALTRTCVLGATLAHDLLGDT